MRVMRTCPTQCFASSSRYIMELGRLNANLKKTKIMLLLEPENVQVFLKSYRPITLVAVMHKMFKCLVLHLKNSVEDTVEKDFPFSQQDNTLNLILK